MQQRQWVFEHTVEGLFRVALNGRLSPPATRALERTGIELTRPLLPVYPVETWWRALEITVADVYPRLPADEAWRRLGHEVLEGLLYTCMGRSLRSAAGQLGPLGFLRRFNTTLRSADNYVHARLEEEAPTRCAVWINEVMGQPAYYQGLLEASIALAGGRAARAGLLAQEGPAARFHVQWDA
ncbi:DUF2378 family protein [Archangium primigenium]|uniref:DUF2378 family protein n=1 Tax=[Archangium] primigenium TaxID=2792470 RepID=UPI00195A293A|nr:DUF2378 family protein [Archangium primigenium]MBM7112337.1 DUF2378 family protein [Archangium primigenium]